MLRDALGEAQAKGGTSGFLSLLLLPGRAAWRPPASLSPNPGGLVLFWEGGSFHLQVLMRTPGRSARGRSLVLTHSHGSYWWGPGLTKGPTQAGAIQPFPAPLHPALLVQCD